MMHFFDNTERHNPESLTTSLWGKKELPANVKWLHVKYLIVSTQLHSVRLYTSRYSKKVTIHIMIKFNENIKYIHDLFYLGCNIASAKPGALSTSHSQNTHDRYLHFRIACRTTCYKEFSYPRSVFITLRSRSQMVHKWSNKTTRTKLFAIAITFPM